MTSDLIDVNFADRHFRMHAEGGADYVAEAITNSVYEHPLPLIMMAITSRTSGGFLDVGANNGLYTLLASATRDDLRTVAFEPYPPAANVCQRNVDASGFTDRVELREIALSDAEGEASLHVPDQEHGMLETSCSLEEGFKEGTTPIRISRRRLDDVTLPFAPGQIKVDVEGHEAAFFRGAMQTIRRHRPIIYAELITLGKGEFYALSRSLRSLDYLFFQMRPDLLILTRLLGYHRLTQNYLLLPRERMPLLQEVCLVHHIHLTRDFFS